MRKLKKDEFVFDGVIRKYKKDFVVEKGHTIIDVENVGNFFSVMYKPWVTLIIRYDAIVNAQLYGRDKEIVRLKKIKNPEKLIRYLGSQKVREEMKRKIIAKAIKGINKPQKNVPKVTWK